MAKRKPRSIVIGSFLDPVRQIWSPNARAFETVRDVVDYLGMKDAYYDDLAYELRVKKEELELLMIIMGKERLNEVTAINENYSPSESIIDNMVKKGFFEDADGGRQISEYLDYFGPATGNMLSFNSIRKNPHCVREHGRRCREESDSAEVWKKESRSE